ncbi:dynein heavy chain family protein [Cardiosporidium cionae]|uniref:Dynein heavy chain family protein n=1 Tax=Cardiosporidium cionae TaxID=476202 RepID=A0ABQ7JGM6_9APIC|nr:dynein heavy chain family protein [Cardiosporidium cionae]|eukprot:KAF8823129.1 dynein heavy chain family protein [Cardiosporidium cionae]
MSYTVECEAFFAKLQRHQVKAFEGLEQDWRNYIASKISEHLPTNYKFSAGKMSYPNSFLHRLLRKVDLILNQQMKEVVDNSYASWDNFIHTFDTKEESQTRCLLTLKVVILQNKLTLFPDEQRLKNCFECHLDSLTRMIKSIFSIESELVPFMNIEKFPMLEITSTYFPLERSKDACFAIVMSCYNRAQDIINHFQQYEFLLKEPIVNFDGKDMTELEQKVGFFNKIAMEISTLPPIVRLPLFSIRCEDVIYELILRIGKWKNLLLTKTNQFILMQSKEIVCNWETLSQALLKRSKDAAEYETAAKHTEEFYSNYTAAEEQIKQLNMQLQFLEAFKLIALEDTIENVLLARRWQLKMPSIISGVRKRLQQEKIEFQKQLLEEEQGLKVALSKHEAEFKEVLHEMHSFSIAMKCYNRAISLHEALNKAREVSLWTSAIDFTILTSKWLSCPLKEIMADDVRKLMSDWERCANIFKNLNDSSTAAKFAEECLLALDNFKPQVRVIEALCADYIHQRHWAEVLMHVSSGNAHRFHLTLKELLEIGVLDNLELLERVALRAQKEFTLEQSLTSMQEEWKGIKFSMRLHSDEKTPILASIDDIQMLLDEQLIKTQTIRCSPYIKPNEGACIEWEAQLMQFLDLLEVWQQCQRSWIYLNPIFSATDIIRQLPVESKQFSQVDAIFRGEMATIAQVTLASEVMNDDRLHTNFVEANRIFDEIQRGLNKYLEMKRLDFARLFFLSNDELLDILSHEGNSDVIQPHLNKIFDGIHRVECDSSNTEINAIASFEGETVELVKPIKIKLHDNIGNAEKWLNQAFSCTKRENWIFDWPSQIILLLDQLIWAKDVTTAINNGQLQKCLEEQNQQLFDVVSLLRNRPSNKEWRVITTLITLGVHCRDVVRVLLKEKVQRCDEFEWLAQLRYSWVSQQQNENMEAFKQPDDFQITVTMMESVFNYCFEYLGPTERLVVTPLTERCHRTLMSAFAQQYGGALEGPAGSGKTESVKDLAKAVAVKCIVFNCSSELDYLSVAKIFKGLAFCGSWCCFDEFNRIDLEVLSVIAQQVKVIQEAIRCRATSFLFDGTQVKLNSTCTINITMNPGYAGRTELPDNLQALFRPCAMMVPDHTMIAETTLQSFGFQEARTLACKVVDFLKLAAEQLSPQQHYDFGMRTLKATLNTAGARKREGNTSESDSQIIVFAIRVANISKLTQKDIPLFDNIILDLFPNALQEEYTLGQISCFLEKSIKQLHLQSTPKFLNKCYQLHNMLIERHGVMLVGKEMSGKSTTLKVLSLADTLLDDGKRCKTEIHRLNPKSVTLGQLFGQFDESLYTWEDGILANMIRSASLQKDSKKHLSTASPATISRCGMVFFEMDQFGWDALFISWVEHLPEDMQNKAPLLRILIESLLLPSFQFVKRRKGLVFSDSENNMTLSFLRLFECILSKYFPIFWSCDSTQLQSDPINTTTLERIVEDQLNDYILYLFVFASVWTVGGAVDSAARSSFESFVRSELSIVANKFDSTTFSEQFWKCLDRNEVLPQKGTLFDYNIDFSVSGYWVPWNVNDGGFLPTAGHECSFDLFIPTVETIRTTFFIELLASSSLHILLAGENGTGKTRCIQRCLERNLPTELYPRLQIVFSSVTSASDTQERIEGSLRKRQRGMYGPEIGKKIIIFIDDLHAPTREESGTQAPIELLRQWMTTGGWYDTKTLEFKHLVDLQFICAMSIRKGNRNIVSARYLRYYNTFFLPPYSNESLFRLLNTPLSHFLQLFTPEVTSFGENIVWATISVLQNTMALLLPIPSKLHYEFNIRDATRIIKGISFCQPESLPSREALINCWAYESERVLCDRLISSEDRDIAKDVINKVVSTHLNDTSEAHNFSTPSFFVDFLDPTNHYYHEANDYNAVKERMEYYLLDYNKTFPKKQLNILFFRSAVEHVIRLWRILRQPRGHALLLGMAGSGRNSVVKLAIHMCGYEVFQIETSKNYAYTDWKDDLKQLLMLAGAEDKPVALYISQNQLISRHSYADISSLLNGSELPTLFTVEEKAMIYEISYTSSSKAFENDREAYAHFLSLCRKNIHIILCLSPNDDSYRRVLVEFPSICNCCTIDWYFDWTREATSAVAQNQLGEMEFIFSPSLLVCDACVDLHELMIELYEQYRSTEGRYAYVTATSFFELLHTFRSMLFEKRRDFADKRKRYIHGIHQLEEGAKQLETMKLELKILRESLQSQIITEEEICAQQRQEAEVSAASCQAQLNEVLPAFQSALASLKKLSKSDITELKSMSSPPSGVVKVMEALCKIFRVRPTKIERDIMDKQRKNDYWEPAKRVLLGNSRFLSSLFDFDKDNIQPDVLLQIEPYENDPDFDPEIIKKASVAATGLCKWVLAIIRYHRIFIKINPKRKALVVAQQELDKATKALTAKKDELSVTECLVSTLGEQLKTLTNEKELLRKQVADCSKKLIRAETLIAGLDEEKLRWKDFLSTIDVEEANVDGDCLVAAAFIVYLGPLSASFRLAGMEKFKETLRMKGILFDAAFSLEAAIGDPMQIQQWQMQCLPSDSISIENALIISKSRRWPLVIDPHKQCRTWLKAMESSRLKILRQSQHDFLRHLEAALQFGNPVLIENVQGTLDVIPKALLRKELSSVGKIEMINLGDRSVEYHPEFRLYITTNLSNPRFPIDLCVRLTLLNFLVTPECLEEQLQNLLVEKEEPEVEKRRQQLIQEGFLSKTEQFHLEQKLLESLSNVKGSLVDDEDLITFLSNTKSASLRMAERVIEQERSRAVLDRIRSNYQQVAKRAAHFFVVVSELYKLDPTYQFDLDWYKRIYVRSIEEAKKKGDKKQSLEQKLHLLIKYHQKSLFEAVCRSLFEKHKLLFAFLLTLQILHVENELDYTQLHLFLTNGISGIPISRPKPILKWLSNTSWNRLVELNALGGVFEKLIDTFESNTDKWREIFYCENPENTNWPSGLNKKLTYLEKCLVLLALRPDAVISCVKEMIQDISGGDFLQFPPYDLDECYRNATSLTPLIFVLSTGMDPLTSLLEFSKTKNMQKKMHVISLGQGQASKATHAINTGAEWGHWVVLQNCHLAGKCMSEIELLLDELSPEKIHAEFRLWLTTKPTAYFPVSILQKGIKITKEQSHGFRQNMLSCYLTLGDERSNFDHHPCKRIWKKLFFGLSLFHCTVQQRKRFGSLGWNVQYDFTDCDREMCVAQLSKFLEKDKEIPMKLLKYTTSEINYGGRITDRWDQRLLRHILDDFYNERFVLSERIRASIPFPVGFSSENATFAEHIDAIKALPILNESPEWLGMHSNARVAASISNVNLLIEDALAVKSYGNAIKKRAANEIALEKIEEITANLPAPFDTEMIFKRHPCDYDKSMNAVLVQEVYRYSTLLDMILGSVSDLQSSLHGLSLLTAANEEILSAILSNRVPFSWQRFSYISRKPLGSWLADLEHRVLFLKKWADEGVPIVFWLSGFFFIPSFLTAIKQSYARMNSIAIDAVRFEFEFLDFYEETLKHSPEIGCYIKGLYLEGARWSTKEKMLSEQKGKIIHSPMPIIWIKPTVKTSTGSTFSTFDCPVYASSQRKDSPSTGNSRNYLTNIQVPISPNISEQYWIKRGVAMLTQLDE